MNIEELAKEFDKVIGPVIHVAEPPTPESIAHIEEHFGVKIPDAFVEFAKSTVNYGNWFASIGPDFSSPTHIITINHKLRSEGNIPSNYIAINVGYDDDFDCIDIETYDNNTGEYLITYWAHDVLQRESELCGSIQEYVLKNTAFWGKNA